MKVFVLFIEVVSDYECVTLDFEIFSNLSNAKMEFEKWMTEKDEYVLDEDWCVTDNADRCYRAYEDGFYARNHVILEIREEDVK